MPMGYGASFDVDDVLGQSRLTGHNDGDGERVAERSLAMLA
jgi:hypothetical protein